MEHEPLREVNPPEWPRPRGYANGLVTAGQGERILFIAGQIGWVNGAFPTDDLVEQFGIALDNVLAVVRAAGGDGRSIARMTVYVTDLDAYRTGLRRLGELWKQKLGRHYPAMALLGVAGLVEPQARVEIEATAVLPPLPTPQVP
ncbi:MAG: RidA family protein [Polyangiaceae bacterium]|jgi:enamine deaminase RidA (YjgF/YER057c/UK114 family)|nr:RidA family protein [Polyangiaceae bacterium]